MSAARDVPSVAFHDDVEGFAARAFPFLLQDEAANNLLLGLSADLRDGRYCDPVLLTVETLGHTTAAALMTPPHNLVLARAAPDTAAEIARALAERAIPVPGLVAPPEQAEAFARAWAATTGARAKTAMRQRIYRLERVQHSAGVPGTLREAREDDRGLLVGWLQAFAIDAALDRHDDETAQRTVEGFFASPVKGLWIWEGDEPLSMAGHTGPTPNGIRISAVYTPPALRGRGYASACVAALSARMLEQGRSFCFLFTDVANPTSNKIYTAIGYEPVCDVASLRFG